MVRALFALFSCLIWLSPTWAVELTAQDEAKIRTLTLTVLESYLTKGDAGPFVDVMPGKAVIYFGGAEQIRRSFAEAYRKQRDLNMRYSRPTISGVSAPFMAGDTIICFIPSMVTLIVNKADEMPMRGFMIASRDKGSDRWLLLGGSLVARDPDALPVIYPGFPKGITLPPVGFSATQ